MAKVIPGRFTAQTDEPFVVFLIRYAYQQVLCLSQVDPRCQGYGANAEHTVPAS